MSNLSHLRSRTQACPRILIGAVGTGRRALESKGISSLERLSTFREDEILQLHGMGPSSIPKLKQALKERGLGFKK